MMVRLPVAAPGKEQKFVNGFRCFQLLERLKTCRRHLHCGVIEPVFRPSCLPGLSYDQSADVCSNGFQLYPGPPPISKKYCSNVRQVQR